MSPSVATWTTAATVGARYSLHRLVRLANSALQGPTTSAVGESLALSSWVIDRLMVWLTRSDATIASFVMVMGELDLESALQDPPKANLKGPMYESR
jgi:hypothetical protein